MMLSAVLQAYVEDIFLLSSQHLFKTLKGDDVVRRYRKTYSRWGNPSDDNIKRLFQRLGIDDVFGGLRWQKASKKQIEAKLQKLNEFRNKIAHGQNLPEPLTLPKVRNLRNFVEQFGQRFGRHVQDKLPE